MDMLVIDMIAQWVFVVTLALYLATNLQWYNYSFKRAIFRHHKFMWHIYYCLVPFTLYFGTFFLTRPLGDYLLVALSMVYAIAIIVWYLRLDKKLNFTKRIVRYFVILFIFMTFNKSLCYFLGIESRLLDLMPLGFAVIISRMYEKSCLIDL